MLNRGLPFPFDAGTQLLYSSCDWNNRTGIGQLAEVLRLREQDVVAMLALYADGSGEHGKGPLVVAGYLANTIDWFFLERDWVRELNAVPKIDYFKARDCILKFRSGGIRDFGGQFKGWSEEAVNKKRRILADIIHRHSKRMVALSSSIQWDEYHSVIGGGDVRDVFFSPYFFGFYGITYLAAEQSNVHFPDHKGCIAFVFDTENAEIDANVELHYRHAADNIPPELAARLGSCTWDTDIKFPMLQIADFLAWCLRAKEDGIQEPLLEVIRDPNSIGGAYERPWRASGLAQFVVKTEDAIRSKWPTPDPSC
jgi:hypothetical protein